MRLIDVEPLEKERWYLHRYVAGTYSARVEEMELKEVPTIDAVPVVHGKWIMTGGMKPPEYHHLHQCSVCGEYAPMRPPYASREMLTPWCPHCMAKMDLEEQS